MMISSTNIIVFIVVLAMTTVANLASAGGVSIERFSSTANCTGPSTTELYKLNSCLHQRQASNPNAFDFLKFVSCNDTDFVQNKYEHTNTKCQDNVSVPEDKIVETIYQRTNVCLVQSDSSSILIECTSEASFLGILSVFYASLAIIGIFYVVETIETFLCIICAIVGVYVYLKFKVFGTFSTSKCSFVEKTE